MKASILLTLFVASLLFVFHPSFASSLENEFAPVFGEEFGINIKIERITEDEIRKIAALGIRNVRTGINWHEVERAPGQYRWNLPLPRDHEADDFGNKRFFTYDEMIGLMHHHGLHVSTVLGEGNSLYTGPALRIPWGRTTLEVPPAPRTPEAIEAFSNFASNTALHYSEMYGLDASTWLIWNEPDFDFNFPPKTDGAIVGSLIESTCWRIKKTVPGARVMGPALSVSSEGLFHYAFIQDLFTRANPLRCLDGFTLHPYRPGPPETAPADYTHMYAILARWQPPKNVPLAVDEWGVSTTHSSPRHSSLLWRTYTEEEQAALGLRMYLVNLASGMPYTTIYEWRDSGSNANEPEDNYGMNAFNGREKSAIQMLRYVWPRLSGRHVFADVKTQACNEHVHALRFADPIKENEDIIVVWTDTTNNLLAFSDEFHSAFDIFGRPVATFVQNEKAVLPINGIPLLISFYGMKKAQLACLN